MQFADYFVGKTIESIEGGEPGDDYVIFNFTDGTAVESRHSQDCCECVCIERVEGDLSQLIGKVITSADEENPDDPCDAESFTWTTQAIAVDGAKVSVVWLGTSNGYYSETPYTRITHGVKV